MIKVDYIGGVNEDYMLTYSEIEGKPGDFYAEHLVLSIEDIQSMIKQFKQLLKPIQFQEAVYGGNHNVEEYYKDEI